MAPSNFQTGLPLHTQQTSGESWKDRNCPGMRTCWSFSVDSFSLNTSDKAVLARRICMLAVLGVRTAMSVLSIILEAFGIHLVGLIIGIILGLIGFFFIAWCLARIGDAEGSRKVLGARIVSCGRSLHFCSLFLLLTRCRVVGILTCFCLPWLSFTLASLSARSTPLAEQASARLGFFCGS